MVGCQRDTPTTAGREQGSRAAVVNRAAPPQTETPVAMGGLWRSLRASEPFLGPGPLPRGLCPPARGGAGLQAASPGRCPLLTCPCPFLPSLMWPHFLWQEPPPSLGPGKKEPRSRSRGSSSSLLLALSPNPCTSAVPQSLVQAWGAGTWGPHSTGPRGMKSGDSSPPSSVPPSPPAATRVRVSLQILEVSTPPPALADPQVYHLKLDFLFKVCRVLF